MQRYLDGLVAVHDFSHGFKESLAEPGGRERLADAVAANLPVRHPVVQTHPETGKKVLFVNAPLRLILRAYHRWSRLRSCSFCGATRACRSSPAA